MSRVNWQEHIVIDPDFRQGAPCFKDTRIPVTTIIGSLADGMTPAEVIAAYPQLTMVAVQAALAYAADILRQELTMPYGD